MGNVLQSDVIQHVGMLENQLSVALLGGPRDQRRLPPQPVTGHGHQALRQVARHPKIIPTPLVKFPKLKGGGAGGHHRLDSQRRKGTAPRPLWCIKWTMHPLARTGKSVHVLSAILGQGKEAGQARMEVPDVTAGVGGPREKVTRRERPHRASREFNLEQCRENVHGRTKPKLGTTWG